MNTIETARLRLRPMVESDAAFLLEVLNEPAFIRNVGHRGVRTDEDVVRNLDLVVEADVFLEHGVAERAAVDRRVRADFRIVADDDAAELRHLFPVVFRERDAEAIGADHGARMDQHALAEPHVLHERDARDEPRLRADAAATADDAVRTLRLARELLDGHKLVKLEVLCDSHTLFPNVRETYKAAEILVREGFDVMVYTSDDPIAARELETIGCVAIMPLASLIGSGMGILNPWNLRLIIDQARVPVLVDAGVGTASDAAIAMELGCSGVLMNTAIAAAQDPVRMARAMRLAIEAGREAFLAGRMPRKTYEASPSSPSGGLIGR